MANKILAADSVAPPPHQYSLPEAARQAILAKSPGHIAQLKIERQREIFMDHNGGCPFGQAATFPVPQVD